MKYAVRMQVILTVETEIEAAGPAQAALEAQAFFDAAGPHEVLGCQLPDEVAETAEIGDVTTAPL